MLNVKPQTPIINWGHPLTKGLLFDVPNWNSTNRPRDIVNNIIGSPTGSNITAGIGPLGNAIKFDGTNGNYIDFAEATAYIVTGSAITLESWAIINDTVGGQFFSKPHAVGAHTSPYFSYAIQTTNLGGRIWVTTSGNSGGVSTSEASMSTGVLYQVVGTYDGSNIQFYLNGVLKATTGASGTLTNFSGTPLKITSNGSNSGEVINAKIFNSRMWNRKLNLAEIGSLFVNPWQIYKKSPFFAFSTPEVIAFESAANSGDIAAANTYSGSSLWSGNNRMLSIDVSMLGPGVNVTSMTYGGAACTFIGSKSTVTSLGGVECWRIIQSDSGAPAAGSNTLVVNLSGSIEFSVEWTAYSGVHQTSPTEGFNSAQATNAGSATDASVAITTVADNDWVHAAIVANDTSITAGNTTRNNISGTLGSGANEDNGAAKTPAGSVTMSYSGMGITTTWAIAGYAIRPVAASSLAAIIARLRSLLGVGL